MQAIILAAGMGKRLKDITDNQTKCMVKVNGKPIINHTLDIISQYPLDRIIIVIGYKGDKLREYLGKSYNNIPIHYIENKIYDTTNNIYSLSLTKDMFQEDDTILLESDILFEKNIFDKLWNDENKNTALVDKYESWMDGTVVEIDSSCNIVNFISKDDFNFNNIENYYKTINIYKFTKDFISNKYIPFLEAYCKSHGHNEFYEQVLKIITYLDKNNIKVCKITDGDKWYEIDNKQDLNNAETIFSYSPEKYQNRYGGYWRFPKLIDFCYLVNPYFPSEKMENEFKCNFSTLLRQYPSGLKTQNILAARMFNCNENNIVVGNGAAEIINALISFLGNKKLGVVYPTFEEYPNRINKENIVKIFTKDHNFRYNVSLLKEQSDKYDNLLLINPDNPSGNFIEKEDVLELLDFLHTKNKFLILDESFLDFAYTDKDISLLENDIINKYPNLIIIKSISKSYGIPGIRLGVMVSSNEDIINNTIKRLSIWNINSYAEFFLQIFDKYKDTYIQACKTIIQERELLYKNLSEINFLDVLESKANYFLCKVNNIDIDYLSQYLLDRNILIKDCSNKLGFDNEPYIRIAVKNREENQLLINSLKSLQ